MKLIFLLALLCTSSFSAEIIGLSFPEKIEWKNKPLVLNGLGIREATVFSVDVYVAGLYLETAEKDPKVILDSPGLKQIRMEFVRKVSEEELKKAWRESLERNCEKDCEKWLKEIEALNALMVPLVKKDTMVFSFSPEGVEVTVKNQAPGHLKGKELARLILSMWLGNPPNSGLKEGLLGKS